MSITKFTGGTNTIQSLSDRPNQTDGLTAAQLKQKFDQYAIDNKAYINNVLTTEIDSTINGVDLTLQAQIDTNVGDITTLQGRATTNENNITGLGNTKANKSETYTKVEIDAIDAENDNNLLTHKSSTDHDGRYYTEAEVQALLLAKTDKTGNHEGTWQGFSPTASEPGIQAVVNSHTSQLADIAVNVKSFGAIGDNITDDTTAINLAKVYAISNSKKLYFPPVTIGYKTTDTVNIDGIIDVVMDSPIIYHGSSDKPILVYGGDVINSRYKCKSKLWAYKYYDWSNFIVDWSTENSVAIQLINIIESEIEIVEASNCTIGLQIVSDIQPFTCNKIKIQTLLNNKYAIDLISKTGFSYITETGFTGGRITTYSAVNPTQSRYAIRSKMLSTNVLDGLSFYNQAIELNGNILTGGAEAIPFILENMNTCKFADFRTERNDAIIMARLTSCFDVVFSPLKVSTSGQQIVETNNPTFGAYSYVNRNKNNNIYKEVLLYENNSIFNDMQTAYQNTATKRVNLKNIINIFMSTSPFTQASNVRSFMQFTTNTPITDQGFKWTEPLALENFGIGIDTSVQKLFRVRKDISRMMVLCFDVDGNYILPVSGDKLVQGAYLTFSTTYFGGVYMNLDDGTDAYGVVDFQVDSIVKKVIVVFGGSTYSQGKYFMGLSISAIYNSTTEGTTRPSVWYPLGVSDRITDLIPVWGTHKVGEIVWNKTPVAGGYEKWICITAGTPGVWKGVGVIQA